jgi:hypothetical protein
VRLLLELLLVAGLLAFAAVYIPILWRRARDRKRPVVRVIPAAAPAALRLAQQDERLHEAVSLRDKIADLARKPEVGLDAVVVQEVDELIAAMVSLHETKTQLGQHLATISDERIARDAALLDAESVASQRRQLEALRQRERSLETELARAVAGLRETWLGLLDAMALPGSGPLATDRVRSQIETLRIRIQAEREARTE